MVRTDQTHISSLLESEFSQLNQEKIDISDQTVRTKFKSYFEQCKIFLFGQINHQEASQELNKSNSSKGVCAKTLSYGDVAWKCETCEKDPTCIICQECFEKGNHKGHKVWLKRNVGGCCDCGDPTAWEAEGSCSDHKGYSSEALLQALPSYIKNSATHVFTTLGKHLHCICLKLTEQYNEEDDSDVKNAAEKKQKCMLLINLIFEFMDEMVDSCSAFIHYITEALNLILFTELKNSNHSCCIRSFISEEDHQQFNKAKRELQEGKKYCTCCVLDLTMQTNYEVSTSIQQLQYEFYFKLFQSFKFKQILGLSYSANLEVLYLKKISDGKSIQSIGVQILTIDDIALMIAKDQKLRNNFVFVFGKIVESIAGIAPNNNINSIDVNNLIHLACDIKYLSKPEALKFLLTETHFLESLLSFLPKLYFKDAMEIRTEHVTFDYTLNKEYMYELEIQLIKMFKSLIKELDYSNVSLNKRLMGAFITFFNEIDEDLTKVAINKGFFSIPLHRIFSFYIDRLILKNYFLKTQQQLQNSKPSQILQDLMRKFIDIPPGGNSQDKIQNIISAIMRPLTRSWAFIHEILSDKWVLSGLYVVQIPNLFYGVFEYFLLLDISLFQILICVSPQPQNTIQTIFDNQSITKQLTTLYQQFEQREVNESQFKKYSPLFSTKKLKTHLQWALRLFIQLGITEISFIYPLKSNNNLIGHAYDGQVKENVDRIFKGELKREIVHNLIKNGGRADIKTVKESSQGIYSESEQFDETLIQVSQQSKDTKGRMTFKLHENKYLSWFDPFYYLVPNNQSKVQEVTNSIYLNQKELNNIVGDYKHNYQYQTVINQVIQEAFAQSSLINIVLHPLVAWINKDYKSTFEKHLIDDQVGHECLKLLILILQNTKNLTFNQKKNLSQTFLKDNGVTINTFLGQLGVETELEPIYRDVLALIYHLDEVEFAYIGERLHIKKDEQEKLNQEQSQVEAAAQLSKIQIKEAQKLKRQNILKNYQAKRQLYIDSNANHMNTKDHNSTPVLVNEEEIECSFCKETLMEEHYYNEPYGQFSYITKTKLMYYAVKQTIESNRNALRNQQYSQNNGEEEEEKKGNHEEELVMANVDLSYLNSESKSGAVFLKCKHHAHFKCLNSYLVTAEADLRNRENRKVLGLDMETFQCPLCKHIANVILPSETLKNFKQMKTETKNFNQQQFLDFYVRFFSQVIKKQNNKVQETLLVDIQKYPLVFMKGIENFFVHRLQIIDIKGTNEFLNKEIKLPGKQCYADLFAQLGNMMRIIYNDTAFPMSGGGDDDYDTSVHTFEQLCSNASNSLLTNLLNETDTPVFEKDFSLETLRILFYICLEYENRHEQYVNMIRVIQAIYKALLLQVLVKIAYIKNNGKLEGSPSHILNQLDFEEIKKQDQQFHEQFIQYQLQFLRKTSSFVLMTYSMYRDEDPKLKKEQEVFCHNLSKIVDDGDEYEYLRSFLNLETDLDKLFNTSSFNKGSSSLQVEEQEEVDNTALQGLKRFEDSNELLGVFEYYRISKVNPLSYSNKSEGTSQIVTNSQPNKFTLKIPEQLILLTTYYAFHLVQLPEDYQTFIQEYYKSKCKNCDKQAKENVVCLLCGDTVCWLSKCCDGLPGMREREGELTYHTRLCEGGCGMFISTSNGHVIMIDGDRSASRQSPYMNKFGETFNKSSKRWENFFIVEEGGGKQAYEELKKLYLSFSIPNEVVKERSLKDSVYRLRIL